MAKSTKLTIKGEGYHITCNNQSVYLNDQVEFVGSVSGGTDILGSFQDANLPDCCFQFEFNNPWIGYPWGAVGPYADDNGWSNDRTNFGQGESKVFHLKFYDGGDDGEYNDFYVRVTRQDDTDTKNFLMELDYWPS
jgi:hypothetical protein